MPFPISVTFQGMLPSTALCAQIEQQVERLQRSTPCLLACRVAVQRKEDGFHKGGLYLIHAGVTLRFEGGYIGGASHRHEDPATAIRVTFETMRRQVEDFLAAQRAHGRTNAPGHAFP